MTIADFLNEHFFGLVVLIILVVWSLPPCRCK
jgi:hypothetical protein